MAIEIERKFLVLNDEWRASAGQPARIRQAYLARNGSMSLRIRITGAASAKLTIKSATAQIRRHEFEYDIPLEDAEAMLGLRESGIIEKLRFKLPQHDLIWEIDVFEGDNQGLIVAEIELPHEDSAFEKPAWLGREITLDGRYSNASLSTMPFNIWPDKAAR